MLARQMVKSRTEAKEVIQRGYTRLDGSVVTKPAIQVDANTRIEISRPERFVSRAAFKLAAALNQFKIAVDDRNALDVGASTGGFCQVLLAAGAKEVVGIDVGHDQLDNSLKNNPRLSYLEGINARNLTPEYLCAELGRPFIADLVVIDVSFISLTQVLEPVLSVTTRNVEIVALVKPQFEAGRTKVKSGIVKKESDREFALQKVLAFAESLSLRESGRMVSPIIGTHGNIEYLLHLSR